MEELRDARGELDWFDRDNENLPASAIGSRLHRLISECRRRARRAVNDHVDTLATVYKDIADVEREAKSDLTSFQAVTATWVDSKDVERWQRIALNRAGIQLKQRRKRPRVTPSLDPRKNRIGVVKRRYSDDAGDNKKLCIHLDFEGVSVVPEWKKKSWCDAFDDKGIRRKVSRYLSAIPMSAKVK